MIEFYFTLKILIPLILVLGCILVVLILIIKGFLEAKLKQNCYDCKHYRLHGVAPAGGRCRYKCKLKDRCDESIIGNKVNLVKCKEFEKK